MKKGTAAAVPQNAGLRFLQFLPFLVIKCIDEKKLGIVLSDLMLWNTVYKFVKNDLAFGLAFFIMQKQDLVIAAGELFPVFGSVRPKGTLGFFGKRCTVFLKKGSLAKIPCSP